MAGTWLFSLGCRQDMHDQPRYDPMEESAFFADRMASRRPIAGTVARGQLRENVHLYTGRDESGELVTALPVPMDRQLLVRGRERYNAFCGPCHGGLGDGNGMVVQRGFRRPSSFHEARLREQPVGYYFDAMTEGFGVMPSYATQVPPMDRWAIAAYIQALQLSQRVEQATLTQEEQGQLPPLVPGHEPLPLPEPAPVAPGETLDPMEPVSPVTPEEPEPPVDEHEPPAVPGSAVEETPDGLDDEGAAVAQGEGARPPAR